MSPAGPTFVCHADGASHGNPGPAGAGVVVLDANGRDRRRVSTFLGEATNNVAEYLAIQEAVKAAADVCREDGLDPRTVSVIIKTDSELVARQISGEYRVRSLDLAPLLRTYRELAEPFYRVQVVATSQTDPRAHELATRAASRSASSNPGQGRYSRLTHLECSRCGERFDPAKPHGPCPACNGPLLARYDLDGLTWPPGGGGPARPASGARGGGGAADPVPGPEANSMWRYHDLLPVGSPRHVVSLGEGLTPLIPLPKFEARLGLDGLGRILLKDEGANPTGTFKARGASATMSRLVELGVDRCAVPTAGNAGSAFAAYAARAGLRFLAAMPENTPELIQAECASYGAIVERVPGLLPDAARYVRERAKGEGWFVASTFDEPYRVEGKKTIALEIFEAFGGRWPDAIIFPVGGGVALVAAWKVMQELAEAGVGAVPRSRGGTRPGPKLFAVQATGCSPVVKAFLGGRDETEAFDGAETAAVGLRVPSPKAGFLILRAVRATGGAAVAVTDEQLLAAADELRRVEGLDICPEGAAAVAALPEMARQGLLADCREIVVVNTGTGLKYVK